MSFIGRAERYIYTSDILYPSNCVTEAYEAKKGASTKNETWWANYNAITGEFEGNKRRQFEAFINEHLKRNGLLETIGRLDLQFDTNISKDEWVAKHHGKLNYTLQKITFNGYDILSRPEKGWGHTLLKPARFVLRSSLLFAVGIAFSPIGLVYNGGKIVVHSVQLYRACGISEKEHLREKIKNAAIAVFQDAFAAVGSYSLLLPALYSLKLISSISSALPALFVKSVSQEYLKPALYTYVGTFTWGPSIMQPGFWQQGNGFQAALEIRNKLGLVDKDKVLFEASNKEPSYLEAIDKAFQIEAKQFFTAIQWLQEELPEEHRLRPDDVYNFKVIVRHIVSKKDHFIHMRGKDTDENVQIWIRHITSAHESYSLAHKKYRSFTGIFSNPKPSFKLDPYLNPPTNMLRIHSAPVVKDIKSVLNLKEFRQVLQGNNLTDAQKKQLPDIYLAIREKILSGNLVFLYEFLGFEAEPTDEKEVKNAFRTRARLIAPDKLEKLGNPQLTSEANEIFRLMLEASLRYPIIRPMQNPR